MLEWYNDHRELSRFCRALSEYGMFMYTFQLLELLEEPYNWDKEHELWLELNGPVEDDDNWYPFCEAMDELVNA